MESPTNEFIKIIPSILWFLFVVGIILLFRKPIRDVLLPRLGSLKAMGVELSFVRASLDAAIEAAEKHDSSLEIAEKAPFWKVEVTHRDKELAINRARQHLDIFHGSRILWVDDNPENNRNERRMFSRLEIEVDIAISTEEGIDELRTGDYDLVISDIARGEDPEAGIKFLNEIREKNDNTPLIFYIGVIKPELGVPGHAFGITNRPDELLHLVLDALERKKYTS